MSTERTSMSTYDCLVLSGGGAKGAFGAGAAKALFAYRKQQSIESKLCFVGTSAGALNAVVLAAFGPNQLFNFWQEATSSKILGWWPRNPTFRLASSAISPIKWLNFVKRRFGKPAAYSLYRNAHLRSFVKAKLKDVEFDKFSNSVDLIMPATNYSQGRMESLFVSKLVEDFVKKDNEKNPEKRRLQEFRQIMDMTELIDSVLASAAIPLAFPPVQIGKQADFYVDGGIGRNTPTQEAALFLRNVRQYSNHESGDTFCVLLDEPGTVMAPNQSLGMGSIALRTYELSHYTHMIPIIKSWHQINRNVDENADRVKEFREYLQAHKSLKDEVTDELENEFLGKFEELWGSTPRLNLQLHEIHPNGDLGNLLDFSVNQTKSRFSRGFIACVTTLRNSNKISDVEAHSLLSNVWETV